MKKTNAVCSWLLSLSLIGHLMAMSYSMLTGWYSYSVCKMLAHLTASVAMLHVLLSIIILFFMNDGGDLRHYTSENRGTIIQRTTAIIISVLLHVHIKAFGFIVSGEVLSGGSKAWILISEILFFGSIFLHLSVSIPRSLISLGLIRSEKANKCVSVICSVVFSILFILTVVALTAFVVNWSGHLE